MGESSIALSAKTRAAVRQAALSFADQAAEIVSEGTGRDVLEALRRRLDELLGGAGAAPRAATRRPGKLAEARNDKPPARRRPARTYDARAIDKFVAVVKEAGGVVDPGWVSKKLRLSPSQRRKLVEAAMKAGKITTRGNKRSTKYVLPSARSAGKRKKNGAKGAAAVA